MCFFCGNRKNERFHFCLFRNYLLKSKFFYTYKQKLKRKRQRKDKKIATGLLPIFWKIGLSAHAQLEHQQQLLCLRHFLNIKKDINKTNAILLFFRCKRKRKSFIFVRFRLLHAIYYRQFNYRTASEEKWMRIKTKIKLSKKCHFEWSSKYAKNKKSKKKSQ